MAEFPELWDGSAEYWQAFVTLDAQRAFAFSPDGDQVPLPLRMVDTLAYGRLFWLCRTPADAADYVAVIAALDGEFLKTKYQEIRVAAAARTSTS